MAQKWSESFVETLCKEHQEGKSPTEIAKSFGVSDVGVRNYLKKLGCYNPIRTGPYQVSPRYPSVPIDKWDTTDRAYIAGLIDGEGTIRMIKNPKGRHSPAICIVNTNLAMLKHLEDKFQRTIRWRRRNGYKPLGKVEVTGLADAIQVLEAVKPFLIAKRLQAIALLLFCKYKLSKWRVRHFVTDTYVEELRAIINNANGQSFPRFTEAENGIALVDDKGEIIRRWTNV